LRKILCIFNHTKKQSRGSNKRISIFFLLFPFEFLGCFFAFIG